MPPDVPRPGYAEVIGEIPQERADAAPAHEPSLKPQISYGPLEVIHESIFGPASQEDWKPISLLTFFNEGWDQPYTNAPEGTNLAPKQPWIGAPAGVFGRFSSVNFGYTNHLNDVPSVFLTPNAPFISARIHSFSLPLFG